MICTPTVYILGAGASHPYDFPTGQELFDRVTRSSYPGEFDHLGFKMQFYETFRSQLLYSSRSSVDAFLERRGKDYLDIGLASIAFHLILCESPDTPWRKRNWYHNLVHRMTHDTDLDGVAKNQVSFVTFNYDRSLEHFLFHTLCNYYGATAKDVGPILNKLNIIHVHGQLGYLPYQDVEPGKIRPYETDTSPNKIKIAVSNVKVIPEGVTDTDEFIAARELLKKAERIAFLGFGFHTANMTRLGFPMTLPGNGIFGTSLGITPRDYDRIKKAYPSIILPTNSDMSDLMERETRFFPD